MVGARHAVGLRLGWVKIFRVFDVGLGCFVCGNLLGQQQKRERAISSVPI